MRRDKEGQQGRGGRESWEVEGKARGVSEVWFRRVGGDKAERRGC